MTPRDSYAKRPESHYADALDMWLLALEPSSLLAFWAVA